MFKLVWIATAQYTQKGTMRAGNNDGFGAEEPGLDGFGPTLSRKNKRVKSSAIETASKARAATGVLMATAIGKKLFHPPALWVPIKNALRAKALL
jgi:hypothetical protein